MFDKKNLIVVVVVIVVYNVTREPDIFHTILIKIY